MSEKKAAKTTNKKDTNLSLYVKKDLETSKNKNDGASISLIQDGEIIECEKKTNLYNKAFKNNNEVVVVNRKKIKGYAPMVFAIILLSGLLFLNVYNQIRLDEVGNDLASMNRQLENLNTEQEEYEQKLAQKDEAVFEQAKNYIENEMGMVHVPKDEGEYIELGLKDETLIIEEETKENGWTTLLSSVGRFFSDLFG